MTIDWQNIVALTVVAFAALYLAREAWNQLAGQRSVRGCTNCAACRDRTPLDRDRLQFVPLSGLSTERSHDD